MCSGGDEPAGRVISSTTVSIPGAQRCSTTKVSRNHHARACSFSGESTTAVVTSATSWSESSRSDSTVSLRPRSYGKLTTMSSKSSGPDGQRPPYVGAMLGVVWQWVRVQLYAGVVAAGFDDLSAAHVALWRYPGLEGVRPSQLADRVGITKQSVNDLLGHLEGHGYLLRAPDSVDGRARVIQLTAKGRRLQET